MQSNTANLAKKIGFSKADKTNMERTVPNPSNAHLAPLEQLTKEERMSKYNKTGVMQEQEYQRFKRDLWKTL